MITLGAALIFFLEPTVFLPFALLSVPLALLVVLRLHSGNMQRIPFDTMAKVTTIARWMGFTWSKKACLFLLLAPYATLIFLVASGTAAPVVFLSFLSLPLAIGAYRALKVIRGPIDPACSELKLAAARLHLGFGILYALSFLYS